MSDTPTIPAQQAERERFIAWYESRPAGQYARHERWEAWQAALASGATQPSEPPKVSQAICSAITAYGDARCDENGTSADRMGDCIRLMRAALAATAAPTESEPVEVLAMRVISSGNYPVLASTVPVGGELVPFVRALFAAASLPPHPTGGKP